MLKQGRDRGFTLVELIIVVAILAALVAIAAPSLSVYIEKSKKGVCEANCDTIARQISTAFVAEASMKGELTDSEKKTWHIKK